MIRTVLILLIVPVLSAAMFWKFNNQMSRLINVDANEKDVIRLFFCGDVMTGRGIDQILPHPGNPELHESYMKNARGYVNLAEMKNGNIPYPVDFNYIWGEALYYWNKFNPDIKIINLETSITTSDYFWPNKAVNYRMSPENIRCLTEPDIDFCALANNHILDFDQEGLAQTTEILKNARIAFSGCGKNLEEARKPAIVNISGKGRVIIFSIGMGTSGIPHVWAASSQKPGVFLPSSDQELLDFLQGYLESFRQINDVVVTSIHWGSNWGYDIPMKQTKLAHRLIDEVGVDVIHGHSSHHFKGIEIYNNKPIFYGSGDFINDYEGIQGHETYRGDLTLMYFVDLSFPERKLQRLILIPLKIKKMQLQNASAREIQWAFKILNREGEKLQSNFKLIDKNSIELN